MRVRDDVVDQQEDVEDDEQVDRRAQDGDPRARDRGKPPAAHRSGDPSLGSFGGATAGTSKLTNVVDAPPGLPAVPQLDHVLPDGEPRQRRAVGVQPLPGGRQLGQAGRVGDDLVELALELGAGHPDVRRGGQVHAQVPAVGAVGLHPQRPDLAVRVDPERVLGHRAEGEQVVVAGGGAVDQQPDARPRPRPADAPGTPARRGGRRSPRGPVVMTDNLRARAAASVRPAGTGTRRPSGRTRRPCRAAAARARPGDAAARRTRRRGRRRRSRP